MGGWEVGRVEGFENILKKFPEKKFVELDGEEGGVERIKMEKKKKKKDLFEVH